MGSTFQQLQYPFVQHQILKTLDTLSNFPQALNDERFEDMLQVVIGKKTPEALFKAESINKPFSGFDFGQKNKPSPWITFIVARVYHRLLQHRSA
jgi:hypothetical protein